MELAVGESAARPVKTNVEALIIVLEPKVKEVKEGRIERMISEAVLKELVPRMKVVREGRSRRIREDA